MSQCISHRSFTAIWSRAVPFLIVLTGSLLAFQTPASGEVRAGAAQIDITPPAGTPSAGYGDRMGQGMEGVHDPLLATALVLDNGEKMIAFVSIQPHLGFGEAMVGAVQQGVHANPATAACEVYLGSSHTHSGGGAYLQRPGLGARLAGEFDSANILWYHRRGRALRGRGSGKTGTGTGGRRLWPRARSEFVSRRLAAKC